MKKPLAFGIFVAALCVLAPVRSFAGALGVPEIDPASAVSGLALVISTSALILERRRRR